MRETTQALHLPHITETSPACRSILKEDARLTSLSRLPFFKFHLHDVSCTFHRDDNNQTAGQYSGWRSSQCALARLVPAQRSDQSDSVNTRQIKSDTTPMTCRLGYRLILECSCTLDWFESVDPCEHSRDCYFRIIAGCSCCITCCTPDH